MQGVITSKEVLGNFRLIVSEFGVTVAGKALWAIVTHKRCTFLSLVM